MLGDLFKNLFKKKRCSDELLLIALEESGADLSQPHTINFQFSSDNAQSARAIAEELSGKGFNAEILLPDEGDLFTCKATKELIPELNALRSLTKEFELLAQQQGAIYDGCSADPAG